MAGANYLLELVTADRVEVGEGLSYVFGYVLWAFLYLWLSVAVFGKTLGKTVMGVPVVGADGSVALHSRQAFLRALTYPLSFVLGMGLFGVVFGRERRAWHDLLARTAVVYDWGSHTARTSTPPAVWLERESAQASPPV